MTETGSASLRATAARNLPLLVGTGVGAVALLLYAFTLSPTLNFIDSGELITVAATAGIAHPPGYPLYTLLTMLAAAVPIGDVALRVNAISALSGALACALFYALVFETLQHHLRVPAAPALPARGRQRSVPAERRATGTRSQGGSRRRGPDYAPADVSPSRGEGARSYSPAVVAVAAGMALLLAAASTFWDWATQAKMYSLHYVFVAGLFWLALVFRRAMRAAPEPGPLWPPGRWPRPVRVAIVLAAMFGLAATNHTMSWLLVPGLALLLLWPTWPGAGVPWRWFLRYLPWLALGVAIPLLLYLYLPIRSAQDPVLNWGTPDNWGDFWRHVTLWQSRGLVGQNTGSPLNYAGRAAGMAIAQWGPLLGLAVFALAVGGLVRLARTNLALLAATLLTAVITLVQTFNFQNVEVAAYNIPWYMLAVLWAGIGLHWLVKLAAARSASPSDSTRAGLPRSAWIVAAVPLLLALLAVVWNLGLTGHRDDYMAEAYLQNSFKSFAPNALVLTNNWYLVSASYYGQYVKHQRPDLAIIDRKLIQYPFYAQYVERQYPEIMGLVKDLEAPFATQARQWVDGLPNDSQQFSQLYFQMMRELVSRNLAAGRPVYLDWIDPGAEENYITQPFSTHPEGLALRVDAQPFTGAPADPQFDWRGVLTDIVPKDDTAKAVLRYYPVALDRLASFAQGNNHPDAAAKFSAEAAQVRAAINRPSP